LAAQLIFNVFAQFRKRRPANQNAPRDCDAHSEFWHLNHNTDRKTKAISNPRKNRANSVQFLFKESLIGTKTAFLHENGTFVRMRRLCGPPPNLQVYRAPPG
jgi:hypothetical protein